VGPWDIPCTGDTRWQAQSDKVDKTITKKIFKFRETVKTVSLFSGLISAVFTNALFSHRQSIFVKFRFTGWRHLNNRRDEKKKYPVHTDERYFFMQWLYKCFFKRC
jgi:hypothetical protein